MTPETGQALPEQPKMSEAGRILNVFLEPRAAFADIAERPRAWVALALLIVMGCAFMAVYAQRIGWGRMFEQQLERNPQVQNMSAEQRAKAAEMNAKIASVMDKAGVVMPVVTVPLIVLLVAGVLALIFKVFMSAELSFKQLFGIAAYGSLPDLLNQAAAIAVAFLKNPDEFNLENPVAFNVGAFLDPQSTSKAVMSLASSIDVFTFWKIALLAVGISVAARKISIGKAVMGLAIPWVLWVLVKTGLAALRG
jgi:hypothetical protein